MSWILRSGAAIALAVLGLACGDGNPAIESVTVLQSTADTEGPYEVTAVVIGANPGHRIELFTSTRGGDRFIPRLMDDEGDGAIHRGEVFTGQIQGQALGTEIRYFVRITDEDNSPLDTFPEAGADEPLQFNITAAP